MAILATIETAYGDERECYVRLNNVEVSNHGVPGYALFRAFLSREAFEGGGRFVQEFHVNFEPDVTAPLWPQAYAALVDHLTVQLAEPGSETPPQISADEV